MAPLKDKLKVLTLNAHSLLEWDNTFCLENRTDAIIREDVDVVVMQEVNQTVEAPYAEPDALKAELRERTGTEPTLDDVFLDATGRTRTKDAGAVQEVSA